MHYEYVGPDPIDHFWLGRIERGDVVEFDEEPDLLVWKTTKKQPKGAANAPEPPKEA